MTQPTFDQIVPGLTGEYRITVTETNTAAHLGSGGVEVLATPEMIRLMEGAAVRAVDPRLPEGFGTVGIRVNVSHDAATPVGMPVIARAELMKVEGRKLTFRVEARDHQGPVGQGTHERMIVDIARFRQRVDAKRAT